MNPAVWFGPLLLVPALLLGQNNVTGSGTIAGRVTDATGAIVMHARITLTDTNTNASITTATNSSGLYVFESVKPGMYNIAASRAGFRKSVVEKQKVLAAQSLTLDFSLEIGAVTESVQVQAAADAQLQTLNSTMGITLSG
ncbi:MAG TPA: carboxypeptidase-like regulatory domain-containing protein, partial [Bryobacteraceae bacterium]|nr:carboxypeptidase-like regulatory domain-containing protein [Bryobacteraceae bacterium]